MKNKRMLWSGIGALSLAAIGAAVMVGGGANADPPDPRTQNVSWANSPAAGANAMHLSVTSNAPVDKRIVTTIARASDGLLVVGSNSTSVYDPTDMGEPGSPLTTDDTVLTLDSHPPGTAFIITSQFYDAADHLTATKVALWTKP